MDMFEDITGVIRPTVRLHSITMKDYRNIEESTIVFPNSKLIDIEEEKPSILGLYGQNGSGKTSVVMALGILKKLLSGESLDSKYAGCIQEGKSRATLSFEFCGSTRFKTNDDSSDPLVNQFFDKMLNYNCFEAGYRFDITFVPDDKGNKIVQIENEQISLKILDRTGTNVFVPKQVFVDTNDAVCKGKLQSFGSKSKYKMIAGSDKGIQAHLYKTKVITKSQSRSFVFSPEFIETIDYRFNKSLSDNRELYVHMMAATAGFLSVVDADENEINEVIAPRMTNTLRNLLNIASDSGIINQTHEKIDAAEIDDLFDMYLEFVKTDFVIGLNLCGSFFGVLQCLKDFSLNKLHVIDTFNMGVINVNEMLPLLLRVSKFDEKTKMMDTSYQLIELSMDKATLINNDDYPAIVDSVESLSSVLNTVIPNLKLEVSDHGVMIDKDNKEKRSIDIIAHRDDVKIPLKYESDGIRRLVSILSPMVGAYNDPSVMLAVDEIDSGLFEYLLGEIMQIMAASSKGQIVFTSHNLRPLEVLPSKYLVFTTTNPKNRYTSIATRGNSNLRDTYFRNIVLGSKSEEIYRPTDQFEIEQAFLIAGE